MNIYGFVPLSRSLPYWPSDLFGQPDFLDEIGIRDFHIQEDATSLSVSGTLLWFREISFGIPGLEGFSIAILAENTHTAVPFEVNVLPEFAVHLRDISFSLRLDSDLLRPVKKQNEQWIRIQDDQGNLLPLEIQFKKVEVIVDQDGDFEILSPSGGPQISIGPVEIGDTGIIVELQDLTPYFSSKTTPPPNVPQGFRGFTIGSLKIHFKDLNVFISPSDLEFENLVIGTGGFSGTIRGRLSPGAGSATLFGIPFELRSLELTFSQNIPTSSTIRCEFIVPFFDKPIGIDISISMNGSFLASLSAVQPTGVMNRSGIVTLEKENLLKLAIESLAFKLEHGIFYVTISGNIKPIFGTNEGNEGQGLKWPTFKIRNLTIDSNGNVHIDGGWLDLPEQYTLDFYGFKVEITKMGLGKTDDGGKWIGFSGSLKLVDGLAAGASVEGLRIIWYDDDRIPRITLNGIGVEFEVPDILRFKGFVSYNEITRDGQLIHRFDGDIKLELISLDLEIDGKLVVGSDTGPQGSFTFFAIYLDVELPEGIPLFSTGVGLYGFAGLFANQMEPNKRNDEAWYENPDGNPGWYKKGPHIGVTDLVNKWSPSPGSLAFGAGVTVGTIADNGYVFNGRMLLAIVFPGPILLIEGKANILTERSKLNDENDPLFRALVVLDNRAGTFLARLDAQFKYGGGAELIDIYGNAEAFFDFNDASAWYLYLGRKEPRSRRIRASVFYHIFEANSYFMLDSKQIATGAWVGFNAHWGFGPLSITLEAWIEGNAILSWKPVHFYGDLWLHGKAELEVWIFGIGLTVDARFAVDVFDPFHIKAELCVGIDLPWPLPDFDVCIGFEWGPEPNIPQVSLPVQEVAIEHPKNSTTWPLPRKEISTANAPLEVFAPLLRPDYDMDNNGFRDSNDPTVPVPDVPENLPVTPLDCRPTITFSRPVNNDSMIGVPSYIQGPTAEIIERIGDPSKNEGPFTVRYGLKEIILHKRTDDPIQTWKPIARKGPDPNTEGIKELYGAWAPVPNMPDGGGKYTANVKLSLWTNSAFEYTRHSGRSWYEWFTSRFTDYPCVTPPPDVEICYNFKDIDPAQELQSPLRYPRPSDQSGFILSWTLPLVQYVTVLQEAVEGLTHALCFPTKENSVRIDLLVPAKRIRIVVVDEISVTAQARDILGNSTGPVSGGTRNNPFIEIEGKDLISVIIHSGYRTCILQICITRGPDPADIQKMLEMQEHLRDELGHWYHEGNVLEPHSIYRLTIVTGIDGHGEGMLAGVTRHYDQTEFAYFSTEGPPGLANLSLPIGIANQDEVTLFDENKHFITANGLPAVRRVFKSELNSLVPYITQTVPATVPAAGEKPPLPRPVYRAYDVGVQFNENYLELMYRMERRDLGLYLYDSNNRPIRDAQGRLIIINNNWGDAEELTLTETDNEWIITVNGSDCANIDLSMIPHTRTLTSLANEQVLEPDYVYEGRLIPLLLHEDFRDLYKNLPPNTVFSGPAGIIDGWTIQDSGQFNGPSTWEIRQQGDPPSYYIIQTSEIAGGSVTRSDPNKPGTMLIKSDNIGMPNDHPDQPSRWTNYRLSVYIRSDDVDIIGISFRYIDSANYYLFAMDHEGSTRRLLKVIDGRYTILAEDDFVYITNHDYLITVEAIEDSLRIYQDGELIFIATDKSISRGTVGLYCWANNAARFSDIRIDDFRDVAPVVYRFKFTTSKYANFFHHMHSFQDETWQVDLLSLANPPSNEEISRLVNEAIMPNPLMIPSHSEVSAYDLFATFVIGQDSRQTPKEVQVMKVQRGDNPLVFFVWSPEPIDWTRTDMKVLHANRLSFFSELPHHIKLTDVSFGTNQPNEESVTLVLREATSIAEHSIEYRMPAGAIAEPVGNPVKFVDEFDEIGGGLLFRENFNPNSIDHYTIVDEGDSEGPSNWYVHDDRSIRQSSRIYGGSILCEEVDKPGTMAMTGVLSWRNIRINAILRTVNVAGAAIGLVFRYKDQGNCYLFSMDRLCGYLRLVRKSNGSTKLLWYGKGSYRTDAPYRVVIEVFEDKLLGYLDDALLFSIQDDYANNVLSSGLVGFYCWKNEYAQFEGLSAESLESSPVLWQPRFDDLSEIQIVDEQGADKPSNWSTAEGILIQSSSIKVEDNTIYQPGTFALGGDGKWDDIEISTRIRSDDEGAIGIMFRVSQDPSSGTGEEKFNYYRYSMDRRQRYQHLIKKLGDVVTELWPQSPVVFQYNVGQSYELTIRVISNQIQGFLDGAQLFNIFDSDLRRGSIGFYCRDNMGARFERVVVTDKKRRVGKWTIVDDGIISAPSIWRVSNNSLNQLSAIDGGSAPAYPGTYVIAGNENWNDYRMEATLRSDNDRAIGIIFRYIDENNYYRLSMDKQLNYRQLTKNQDGIITSLWEDTTRSYEVGEIFTLMVDVIGSRLVGYMNDEHLFDVADSANPKGKIGLYCWANSRPRFERVEVRRPPLDSYALFQDHLSRNDITGFTFIDEGTLLAPSVWNVYEGALRQTSGIYSDQTGGDSLSEKGTYALFGDLEWTDVVISVRLRSLAAISGFMGLMFRYQDPNNYYRISMDSSLSRLRLVKNLAGSFSLLWEDVITYGRRHGTELTVVISQSNIRCFFDGKPVFVIEDSDHTHGRVGLYCAANTDARFSDIRVYPIILAFNNWMLSEQFEFPLDNQQWMIKDEGDQEGPSKWGIMEGELRQTSDIHDTDTTDANRSIKLGTYIVTGSRGASWTDYRLIVRMISDDANGAIGVLFRYQDADNYYRFSMYSSMESELSYHRLVKKFNGKFYVLWENAKPFTVGREYLISIDCDGDRLVGCLDGIQLFDAEDQDLSNGGVGLYCWKNTGARFLDIFVAEPVWANYYTFSRQETKLPAGSRIKLCAGNQLINRPTEENNTIQKFIASMDENGHLRFPNRGVDLRLVEPDNEIVHARRFLPEDDYVEVDNIRVLRKADGTGFFIIVQSSDSSAGSELVRGQYRLFMNYNRDNMAKYPDSQVLKQANSTCPEKVVIDIPWKPVSPSQ